MAFVYCFPTPPQPAFSHMWLRNGPRRIAFVHCFPTPHNPRSHTCDYVMHDGQWLRCDVTKCGTAREISRSHENKPAVRHIHVNIFWHMRIACWISKAADTHTEYIILLFYWNKCWTNAPQYYVICTLPILYVLTRCVEQAWMLPETQPIFSVA
jgi:hypothetical protein